MNIRDQWVNRAGKNIRCQSVNGWMKNIRDQLVNGVVKNSRSQWEKKKSHYMKYNTLPSLASYLLDSPAVAWGHTWTPRTPHWQTASPSCAQWSRCQYKEVNNEQAFKTHYYHKRKRKFQWLFQWLLQMISMHLFLTKHTYYYKGKIIIVYLTTTMLVWIL